MLSLGTDDFLAFWIASYSVGLPAGSPPPVRAATSMFLISLANSLPRLASTTAFLCLVVAHLEWPDMNAVLLCVYDACGKRAAWAGSSATPGPHDVDDVAVDAVVPGDLGMERRREQMPLLDGDDPTDRGSRGDPGQDVDLRADLLHPRRTDEQRVERRRPVPAARDGLQEGRAVDVGLEGVDLTPERVAPHRHVQPAKGLLAGDAVLDPVGEHDHPRTGAERRQARAQALAQRLEHLERDRELVHRGGLAAGHDDAVEVVEVGRTAYLHRPRTGALEHREVLAHVSLQGEHADHGGRIHRSIVRAEANGHGQPLPRASAP